MKLERLDTRRPETIIKLLTDDPAANPMALGCACCPQRQSCGGLSVPAAIMDCLDLCCQQPEECTRVCRRRPVSFVEQIREIKSFELGNVDRAPNIPARFQSNVIPLIYHGSSRGQALESDAFALALPDLVHFTRGELRYSDREALCRAFGISPSAQIILTGVNTDHRIEPWWALGDRRPALIQGLRALGVELVTTPNFSVVLDQPRTDDLHAIKRIAILFAEFQNYGLACALHPNGRTDKDFERWGEFIAARPEVSVLAYEFTTGPARKSRKPYHLARLADLAKAAGRPLDIVVRGDPRVITFLRQHYRDVIYIETTAFMKSIQRQRAERCGNNKLRWVPYLTKNGEKLDSLFVHNLTERTALLGLQHYGPPSALSQTE